MHGPRKVLLLALALLFSLSQCGLSRRELPVAKLSSDLEPLRTAFNKDTGKVRLLLLVDPT